MSEDLQEELLDEVQDEIKEQAKCADIKPSHKCTEEDKVQCATLYGPNAVENKIIISISANINTMAEAIKESENQKHTERD